MPQLKIACFALLLALALPPARAAEPRPSGAPLRERLLREYGIEALDKTDTHSPTVLASLLLLLDKAFPPTFVRKLKNLHYLYAYAGHDSTHDLGAFHPEARAISVAGLSSFPAESPAPDLGLLATLAHELGHAFVLEKVTPAELQALSEKSGGWGPVFAKENARDLYAPAFFSPHPFFARAREFPGEQEMLAWKKSSLCSRLSTKNVHEWFADSFAAVALQKLGREGMLGAGWQERLLTHPRDKREYWSNYNWVSEGFSAWLQEKARLR